MNFMLFYSLFASISLQTLRALSSENHVSQIDEFIKQLLVSEKFNDLANLIADKAAQKIKDLSKQSVHILRQSSKNDSPPSSTDKSNEDHENSQERDSRNDETSNSDRGIRNEKLLRSRETNNRRKKHREHNFRSEEKIGHEHVPQNKEKNQLDKFGKVDMDAFLKNHMTSNELELNFKHLKSELEKHRFSIKGNEQNNQKESNEKRQNQFIDHNRANEHENGSNKSENTSEDKNQSNPISEEFKESFKITDITSNENVDHELSTFYGTRDKKKDDTNSRTNKSSKDSAKVRNPVPQYDKQTNNSEDLPISFEDNNNNKKALIGEVIQKVSEELNERHHSSKEIMKVGVNRAISDESKENVSKHHGKYKTEKVVKMENGKQYAFQSSSEYAEYHENVAIEKKGF